MTVAGLFRMSGGGALASPHAPPLSLYRQLELAGAPGFRSCMQRGGRRVRGKFCFFPSGGQKGMTPLRESPLLAGLH